MNGEDNGGLTALLCAAEKGHVETVNALLGAGANVNAKTYFGWTALKYACVKKQDALALKLIEKGADVHAKHGRLPPGEKTNRKKARSTLELARRAGLLEVIAAIEAQAPAVPAGKLTPAFGGAGKRPAPTDASAKAGAGAGAGAGTEAEPIAGGNTAMTTDDGDDTSSSDSDSDSDSDSERGLI